MSHVTCDTDTGVGSWHVTGVDIYLTRSNGIWTLFRYIILSIIFLAESYPECRYLMYIVVLVDVMFPFLMFRLESPTSCLTILFVVGESLTCSLSCQARF